MNIAWFCLAGAVIAEITMIALTKASDGWTKFWPTLGLIAAAGIGMYLIARAAKDIPISTAYAIWTGLGGIGAAIIGMAYHNEPASILKILCILSILAGVVGLKLLSAAA